MRHEGDCGWRQRCGTEGGLPLECHPQITGEIPPRVSDGHRRVYSSFGLSWLLGRPLLLSAQTLHYAKSPDVRNGEKVYKGGCIALPRGAKGRVLPWRVRFHPARYVSGLYRLRGYDSGAER